MLVSPWRTTIRSEPYRRVVALAASAPRCRSFRRESSGTAANAAATRASDSSSSRAVKAHLLEHGEVLAELHARGELGQLHLRLGRALGDPLLPERLIRPGRDALQHRSAE